MFIDTADKAFQSVRQINHTAVVDGNKPIVFTTLVNMEILKILREGWDSRAVSVGSP